MGVCVRTCENEKKRAKADEMTQVAMRGGGGSDVCVTAPPRRATDPQPRVAFTRDSLECGVSRAPGRRIVQQSREKDQRSALHNAYIPAVAAVAANVLSLAA